MMQYIDLQRRFRTLTEAELEDAELLTALDELNEGKFRPSTAIGWSKLLQYDRVILLAGAGAGKTREMEEQAKHLVGEGRFAFFVPLESLDREAFVDLLSTDEQERFEAWKADGGRTGVVFPRLSGRVETDRRQARPSASAPVEGAHRSPHPRPCHHLVPSE